MVASKLSSGGELSRVFRLAAPATTGQAVNYSWNGLARQAFWKLKTKILDGRIRSTGNRKRLAKLCGLPHG
jgi:hypothetical protein